MDYDILNNIDNRYYSIIAQADYTTPLWKGELNTGAYFNYKELRQAYNGGPESYLNMRQHYVYIAYTGRYKRLSYYASLGANAVAQHPVSGQSFVNVIPYSSLTLFYRFTRTFSTRLIAKLKGTRPTTGDLAENRVNIDSRFIATGNPALKPYRTFSLTFKPQYSTSDGRLSLSPSIEYLYSHHPNVPCLLSDGDNIVMMPMRINARNELNGTMIVNYSPCNWMMLQSYYQYFHDGYSTPSSTIRHNYHRIGAMLAVQYVIGQLNSPVAQIMSFIYSLQDVKISLERINEIHGRRNEEDDGELLTRYADDKNRSITLNGIDFRYDLHALKNTLDNITFTVPQGQVTAIVGASGSGKTTMIKLMLGYYRVNCGSIDIAGADINRYSMTWWRRRCGVVMQEGVIFSESIARNIAVSDGDIDEARLEEAARTACIHDYIMSLPLRYNTKIGRDGVGLSQGQKQRILIARAVYRNPDYIFLDEATNSLDARNEREIVSNLSRFYRGRTVVVVAHRLSTVRDADNIIVLDAGRIVESGNHDSLIAARGHYYNLVKNQLELGN